MKIAGSGSGSISQRQGSADPDLDPDQPQNVMDLQHCLKPTEDHETLVDVVGLLQGLPLAARLLGHLTAGQVNKVDLAMSRYVHTLYNVHMYTWRKIEGQVKVLIKNWMFYFFFSESSFCRYHLKKFSCYWKPLPKNRWNKDKSS